MSAPSWAQILAKDSSQKVGERRAVLGNEVQVIWKPESPTSPPAPTTQQVMEVEQALTHNNPLNREFPSLSGAPQTQQPPTPSQAIWNNSGIRGTQQGPVQRPQGQTSGDAVNQQQPPTLIQPQQQHRTGSQPDSQTSSFPQLGSNIDEFRFDDQGHTSRLQRATNRQESEDDFPPLGGLGDVDSAHLRRPGPGQTSSFAGLGGSNDFGPPSQQTRNGLLGRVDSHPDNIGPSETAARFVSPTGLNPGELVIIQPLRTNNDQ